MKNLICIKDVPIEFYKSIVAAKYEPRKTRLGNLESRVTTRYNEYLHCTNALSGLAQVAYGPTEKEDLQHCYASRTIPLDELKRKIRTAQSGISRALCPYCGINSHRTFDHYLPQSFFPEFSVLSWNLSPMCDECNNIKLDRIAGPGAVAPVLNLYFDILPNNERWLRASVALDAAEGVPVGNFFLCQSKTVDKNIFRTIQSHYETLNLCDRYSGHLPVLLSEVISNASAVASAADIGGVISSCARGYERAHGLNFWKVAALDAISHSKECLQFISEMAQP